MGTDKGLIKIDGRTTIVEGIIGQLKNLFDEIIIVTNNPSPYRKFKAKVVEDLIKEKGPLGGIFSGLSFSTSEQNFVVGCDMPFLHPQLIEYIIDKPGEYDVVIPERNGRFETLFARYSKSVLPTLFTHLIKEELRIQDIFEKLHVLKISAEEVERFDPKHRSFFNINSREDLEKLQSRSQ
jgi:molybdopterin-guanine dinucleotide biosynthesis protein A